MEETARYVLQVGASGLMNLGLALLVGALAHRLVHHSFAVSVERHSWAARTALRLGAALSVSGLGLSLWAESALMNDVPLGQALSGLGAVLTDSHFGHAWLVGMSALAIISVVLLREGQPSSGPVAIVGALMVIIFAGSRSAVSHAVAADGFTPIAIDFVHLLLVSFWSGEVFLAASTVFTPGRSADDTANQSFVRYIESLSSTATWALGGVVITGLFSSWRGLNGSLPALLTPGFGITLFVKLLFVSVAVALGGFNRMWVMPALLRGMQPLGASANPYLRRFVFVLRVESVALLAALLVAAVLTSSQPVSPP